MMTGIRGLAALVIDDEPAIRELFVDMLKFFVGVDTVDVADSGAAGLALFDRHHYDVVLTDFLMPGLSGTEVADALLRRDPRVKVVMLSGSVTAEDVDQLRARGIVVLAKPVSIDCFKATIERVLRGQGTAPL